MSDGSPGPRWIISLGLLGFVVGGSALENAPRLQSAKSALRGKSAPAGLPDDGGGRLSEATARLLGSFASGGLFSEAAETMPSSILAASDLRHELPSLSLATDDDSLYDPETGILVNRQGRGREWERLAWVSLYEQGRLQAGMRVGLRLQGDSSRRSADLVSFRLLFRPEYGSSPRQAGRLLGADGAPTAALVVRRMNRRYGRYPDLFAFEIAQKIGSRVPDFRPVQLYLNGEPMGVTVLSQHVSREGWGQPFFGDLNFEMYAYKSDDGGSDAYDELASFAANHGPLTLEAASEMIDVDNLTRHLLTVMFCGTSDWAQGAVARDRDDPAARWLWLHWDMDQSFAWWGHEQQSPWDQPAAQLVTLTRPLAVLQRRGVVGNTPQAMRHLGDPRRRLFNRLVQDPGYRAFLAQRASDTLNHLIDREWLAELADRYAFLEAADGTYGGFDLREFFNQRAQKMRTDLSRELGLGPTFRVQVSGPPRTEYEIDGFDERGHYTGDYFEGQSVRAEVVGAHRAGFSHWLVNGERVDGRELVLVPVKRQTRIRPVLQAGAGRPPPTSESVAKGANR